VEGDVSINKDIDAMLYPLSLADHKPVAWPQPPAEGARPQTPVEVALGLFPGEELDVAWYQGKSPLQEEERKRQKAASYWRLKHI
jgi:hypothetical protein